MRIRFMIFANPALEIPTRCYLPASIFHTTDKAGIRTDIVNQIANGQIIKIKRKIIEVPPYDVGRRAALFF